MAKIIDFFKAKNKSADFESTIAMHIDRLYRISYKYCGCEHSAEDLLQSFLVKLYHKKEVLHSLQDTKSWLIKSLHNHYIDQYRKQRHMRLDVSLSDDSFSSEHPRLAGADDTEEQLDIQLKLDKAVSKLNPDQRAILVLHDMEGYTLTELEALLEIPLGTLKSRLHRARADVRKRLYISPETRDNRASTGRG